jgi:hypothetical protein
MDSVWVFLAQHGVDPTHSRAEQALRFGVTWRLQSRSTYAVRVEAAASLFTAHQADVTTRGCGSTQ